MMNAVRQLGSEGIHVVQGRVIAIIYCAISYHHIPYQKKHQSVASELLNSKKIIDSDLLLFAAKSLQLLQMLQEKPSIHEPRLLRALCKKHIWKSESRIQDHVKAEQAGRRIILRYGRVLSDLL